MEINAYMNNKGVFIDIECLYYRKALPVQKAELYVEIIETPFGDFTLRITNGEVKVSKSGTLKFITSTRIRTEINSGRSLTLLK